MPEQRWGRCARLLGRFAAAMAVAALATGCAHQATVSPAQVDRLGALFTQTVPIAWMVERIAEREAAWPFQEHAGKFTAAQLACTRGQLTADKIVVTQQADARDFARRHPDRVADSIKLLEDGAAEALGDAMRAGAVQGMTGRRADTRTTLGKLSSAQLRGFMELTQGSQYTELRRALRLDGLSSTESRAQSRSRGYQIGQALLIGPLLAAMEHCRNAPAELFDAAGTPT